MLRRTISRSVSSCLLRQSVCSLSIPITISRNLSTMAAIQPSFDNIRAAKIDGVMSYSEDKYDGVIINSHDLPTLSEFENMLHTSIAYWRSIKRRGVWLKIPIERSELVPLAVSAGFVFHHAEKEYLMLNHWLSDEENRMPANATHQVGIGSVVIHNGKILAVQEKNGPLRGTGIWKMPTGLADAGEDICDTAEREVYEETGIETEFISVLSIRQSHTALFGKSDLFFICLLRPKTIEINMQAAEIIACEWLDADIFLKQRFFQKSPIFTLVNDHVQDIVRAVANDPAWGGSISAEKGLEETRVNPFPPVPSFVKSKLPNGIRPGESVLFHMPIATTSGSGSSTTASSSNV